MKIAVVGGGIVGATATFYLARQGHTVHLFDEPTGQATSAAAGIICPWLSQRRNKKWYRLTANGAAFYQVLLHDLEELGIATEFYRQNGTYIFKDTQQALEKLESIALEKREVDAMIGTLKQVPSIKIQEDYPELTPLHDALYASGGAVIDGKECVKALQTAALQFDCQVVKKRMMDVFELEKQYDKVLLTVGAWLPILLEPMGYQVDIRAQKGQLFESELANQNTADYPVWMLQGELDILTFPNGKWVVGATHENDGGYDLSIDTKKIQQMKQETSQWVKELEKATIKNVRVGTRAYTSDFTPFFGLVPDKENLYVASGLGSSGLTNGAYIGYLLAAMAMDKTIDAIDVTLYSPDAYIKK